MLARRAPKAIVLLTISLASVASLGSLVAARAEVPGPRIVRGPVVAFDSSGPTITVTVASASSNVHVHAQWTGAQGVESRDVAIASGRAATVPLGSVPPSTVVGYDVLAGETSLGHHELTTLPARGTPFVFCALGDTGEAHPGGTSVNDDELAVARALEAEKPALVLHTGDVIYPQGQESGLDSLFFEPYAATLARVPLIACLGNHDVRTEDGRPELASFPHAPNENADRYFSFDAGGVHFVILDSNEALDETKFPQSKQARWLKADLAAARADWKIAVLHHPLYSAPISRIWEIESVRASLEGLFHEGGVDLVLCGHDHFYHRTPRVLHGARDDKGMVHVVTGGGGATLYPATKGDETAAAFSRFHFVKCSVKGRQLELVALSPRGAGEPEKLDSVTLTHGKVWR